MILTLKNCRTLVREPVSSLREAWVTLSGWFPDVVLTCWPTPGAFYFYDGVARESALAVLEDA